MTGQSMLGYVGAYVFHVARRSECFTSLPTFVCIYTYSLFLVAKQWEGVCLRRRKLKLRALVVLGAVVGFATVSGGHTPIPVCLTVS